MTVFEPESIFVTMSDEDMAEIGLLAAEVAFDHDCSTGFLSGQSLAIVVGTFDNGMWNELGRSHFGPDAARFDVNIDSVKGKLATALIYEEDSIKAYWNYGDRIPEGPQRWTGAVYHVARVETLNGWMERVFVGAASGVQGHYDQATTYTALTRMGALWAIKMQALYGKAA